MPACYFLRLHRAEEYPDAEMAVTMVDAGLADYYPDIEDVPQERGVIITVQEADALRTHFIELRLAEEK